MTVDDLVFLIGQLTVEKAILKLRIVELEALIEKQTVDAEEITAPTDDG